MCVGHDNPKGIVSSSPGLRGTSYPGCGARNRSNPNGVAASTSRRIRNPVGVEAHSTGVSQGSSCLATLGFGPESRWDSILRHPKVVGNRKDKSQHSKNFVRHATISTDSDRLQTSAAPFAR